MRNDVLELLREAGGYISGEKMAERLGVTRAAVWKKIAALREAGYDIASAPRSGYVLRCGKPCIIPRRGQKGRSSYASIRVRGICASHFPAAGQHILWKLCGTTSSVFPNMRASDSFVGANAL